MGRVSFTTKGWLEVWYISPDGDVYVSRHRDETEATESASAYAETLPAGDHTFEFRYPRKVVKVFGVINPNQGGDVTAPTVPQNVVEVSHTATTATIAWDASTDNIGVSGYQVFKDGLPVELTPDLSYQYTGLTPSTQYSLTVAAYDAAGNYSGESTLVLITTDANAAPVWSVGTQDLTTGDSYTLDLTSVCSDADGNALTFSQVSGTLPTGVTFNSVAKTVSGTPSAVQTAVVTFRASDGITTTDQAITFEVLDADATAPNVPTLTAGAPSSSTIALSWTTSTDTGPANERATGVASYKVYRSTDGVTYSLRTTTASTSYTDTGLSTSTMYYYKVSAVDGAGNESAQSAADSATTASNDWQLASGHYVPAKMQAVIIHPRPDAETNSWERHRMAPDGIAWRIPIAVQGGSWPFQYTVDATSAAKGITIGQHYGDTDYGILSWASPTIGSHTITVTVKTQENGRNTSGFSEPDPVVFTLAVADKSDTSKFVFIDPAAADDSGSGAYLSPKKTLASVFDSTSFGNRQVFLRAGTHNTNTAARVTVGGSTKPGVLVGFPGESATIAQTSQNIGVGASGAYFGGIALTDGGYGAITDNVRMIACLGTYHRVTLFGLDGSGVSNGILGNDNTTMFFASGGTGQPARNYISIIGCSEVGRPYSSNAAPLFVLFSVSNSVAENNYASGAGVAMFMKDSISNVSFRANEAIAAGASNGILATGCQLQNYTTENVEICWNKGSGSTQKCNLQWVYTTGVHWVYRNSIDGDCDTGRKNIATCGPYYYEKNAIQGSIAADTQVVETDNIKASSGLLDTSINLTAGYAAYVGTHGAEVA